MRLIKIIVPILSCILFSCEPTDIPNNPTPPTPSGPTTDTTITANYGSTDPLQNLTFALPAGRTDTTRMVIIVHGGSWNAGDKADLNWLQQGMKSRGFATANINYRLHNNSADNYKMKLDDVDSAVQYVIRKAASFKYSASKIYIVGHSAGGHLSLCEAYSRNANRKIKAVGSLAGPTDLYEAAYSNFNTVNPILQPFLGMPLYPITPQSTQRYKDASPRYQATASAAPTIFFHGDWDFVVGYSQSTSLAAHLTGIGVPNRLVTYNFTFHDWWGDANKTADTMDKLANWFFTYN